MRYVRPLSLLPSEEFFAESDDNTRLALVLRALPDEPLPAWLRQCRDGHCDRYPYEVLWCCLIAKYVYQIITYAELIRELWRNESLRRLVDLDSPGAMPQDYHFSRLLKRLAKDAAVRWRRWRSTPSSGSATWCTWWWTARPSCRSTTRSLRRT